MKKTLLFLATIAFLAFSCSKEEVDPVDELEDIQFDALMEEEFLEVPEALQNENPYAQTAASWIQLANSFRTLYSGFYTIPEGAVKSNTPINAGGARISAISKYLVYTWSYGGLSCGYQVHATSDSYVLEIFLKVNDGPWQQLLYASQNKDGKSGEMKFYDSDTNELVWTYAWEVDGDQYYFSMFDTEGEKIELFVNKSTGAGDLDYYEDNQLQLSVTWTGQGSGSWTYYGEQGQTSGTWEP